MTESGPQITPSQFVTFPFTADHCPAGAESSDSFSLERRGSHVSGAADFGSSDAIEASIALRNRLNAREAGKCTTGVGLKQTGGEFTTQLALFVYVPRKRSPEDILEGELVPREFGGYVTDVVEARPTLIDDTARYDLLRGGIEVSRERLIQDGIFAPPTGTLGALVTSTHNCSPVPMWWSGPTSTSTSPDRCTRRPRPTSSVPFRLCAASSG
ncbi:hypothetical protein [Streptomyces sp. NPDC097610]|uniref:hypothetical protein n=1 Tax=Streptomyces sp. NPDC097610 TaxID=3157227 RepID=UPI0033242972